MSHSNLIIGGQKVGFVYISTLLAEKAWFFWALLLKNNAFSAQASEI